MTDPQATEPDDGLEAKLQELRPQQMTFRRWIDRHWGKIWLGGLFTPSLALLNAITMAFLAERFPSLRGSTGEFWLMIGFVGFNIAGLLLCLLAVLLNRELKWLEKLFFVGGSVVLVIILNVLCTVMMSAFFDI